MRASRAVSLPGCDSPEPDAVGGPWWGAEINWIHDELPPDGVARSPLQPAATPAKNPLASD